MSTKAFSKLSKKQMMGLLSYYTAKESSLGMVGSKNLPLHQLEIAVRELNITRMA